MSAWWDEASRSAAREFGARHYRWFAVGRVGLRLLPVVGGLMAIAGFWFLAVALAANWDGIWAVGAVWLPKAMWWVVGAAALAAVAGGSVWAYRNWWRWSLRPRPFERLRYRRW